MVYKVFHLLLLLALLSSCNLKRSLVSESSVIRNDSSSSVLIDSSKVNADKKINISENTSEKDNSYQVVAEFDSMGNITRLMYMLSIKEMLNNKSEFSVENFNWLSGLSVISQDQKHSQDITNKNENIQQKSKAGAWIWITVVSVLTIILVFILIKSNLWR